MSDAPAFFRAIEADPDDDTPRLVYADWLDEHARGEADRARAEFVRVQCELARVAESGEVPRELAAHERRLVAEQRSQCLTQLQPLGIQDVRFQRGFIDKVQCTGTRFLNLPRGLFRYAPALRGMILRDLPRQHREDLRKLVSSPWFACLTALDLADNALGTAAATVLASASRLAQLTTLQLSRNQLAGAGLQELLSSPHLGILTTLGLSGNQLGAADARALARTPRLASLATLNLDQNSLGDDGLHALSASRHFAALRSLSLAHNGITLAGVRALARAPDLTRLTALNLADNVPAEAGAAMLASSSNFSQLATLNLAHCQVGDEGVRTLAASMYLPHLVTLDLSGNGIRGGAQWLAQQQSLGALRTLNLSDNAIDDDGAGAIAASPALARLTALDLRNNPLSDHQVLREKFGDRVLLEYSL